MRAPGTEPGTKQELLPVPTTPPALLSALPTQRAAGPQPPLPAAPWALVHTLLGTLAGAGAGKWGGARALDQVFFQSSLQLPILGTVLL